MTKIKALNINSFTKNVLLALCLIPKGEVRSYKQIACAINNMRAVRAVGSVCKHNPFPIEIPCHRVVTSKFLSTHSKNDVGNYSAGGINKKIALLEKEGIEFRK